MVSTAVGQGLKLVATIRSSELRSWDNIDGEIGRAAQDVLLRASQVNLSDNMSEDERTRALRFYPKQKFGRGLGESFIAGELLKRRFDNGESAVVAIVWAAT